LARNPSHATTDAECAEIAGACTKKITAPPRPKNRFHEKLREQLQLLAASSKLVLGQNQAQGFPTRESDDRHRTRLDERLGESVGKSGIQKAGGTWDQNSVGAHSHCAEANLAQGATGGPSAAFSAIGRA
jgi:hypothetical protein